MRIASSSPSPRHTAPGARPLALSISSVQASSRSPIRMAAPAPKAAAEPRQPDAACRAAKRRCTDRLAAAGRARVHHVVVHQSAGVQQLERGGSREDLAAVGAAACPPAPVAEPGPQPLAAGQQVIDRVDARQQVGADPAEVLALPSDELGQRGADLRPDPWSCPPG